MTSITGYISYLKYTYGTEKGDHKVGDVWNEPHKLGDVDGFYTSENVVETITAETAGQSITVAWTPVVKGAFVHLVDGGEAKSDVKIIKANGTVEYADVVDDKIDGAKLAAGDRVAYKYNNTQIHQDKLPTLKAEMVGKAVEAKARRIAIHYSQMSAFQAKQDYGMDLQDMLAEQATGILAYEIDTEIINLLAAVAKDNTTEDELAQLTWSKTLPVGVSKKDHYEGFGEIIEIGKQIMFDKTKKFAPNYIVCSSSCMPVFNYIPGFKAAPATGFAGPHFAGEVNGIKIFVSPTIAKGEFLLGLNGEDMMSSVAAYMPYLPVVPTALLQGPDGATSQGFSTMYGLVKLNDYLILRGKITD